MATYGGGVSGTHVSFQISRPGKLQSVATEQPILGHL